MNKQNKLKIVTLATLLFLCVGIVACLATTSGYSDMVIVSQTVNSGSGHQLSAFHPTNLVSRCSAVGQSFTTIANDYYAITSVAVRMSRSNDFDNGFIIMQIFNATNNLPDGAPLCASNPLNAVPFAHGMSTGGLYNFTFAHDSSVYLTPNARYFFQITAYNGTFDSTHYVVIRDAGAASNYGSGGQTALYSNSTWSTFANNDLNFYIYATKDPINGCLASDFAVSSTQKDAATSLSWTANKIYNPLNTGGQWIFSWDASGTYVNDTAVDFTQVSTENCTTQKTIPALPAGTVIHWRIYASDSSNTWLVSAEQSFTVSIAVTFLTDTGGSIMLNGQPIANGTVNTYTSVQVLNLIAVVDSGYGFHNWTYTTGTAAGNPFAYSVSDNAVVYCNTFTYSSAYDAGNTAGYSAGYFAGYAAGYNEGYNAGNATGYALGWTTGNVVGYASGYSTGYSSGWTTGYNAGWAALAAQITAILEAPHTIPPPQN